MTIKGAITKRIALLVTATSDELSVLVTVTLAKRVGISEFDLA